MPLLNKFIDLNWQATIALLALGFSIWQGWQIRRHNKLSSQATSHTKDI